MMKKRVVRKTIHSPDGKTIAYAESVIITSDDLSDDCPNSDSSKETPHSSYQTVSVHISTNGSHSSSYSSSRSSSHSSSHSSSSSSSI